MPYTAAGIYYPDSNTAMSVAAITQNIAESINGKLGIAQVSYSSTSVVISNSSSTAYGNSGLSATIKPKSVSNKIVVLVHLPFQSSAVSGLWSGADFRVNRGTSVIAISSPGVYNVNDSTNGGAILFSSALSMSYLDAPASTTELTYTVQGKMWQVSPTASAQTLSMNYSDAAEQSTLILMEVAQ
jgi:hypothetical protein